MRRIAIAVCGLVFLAVVAAVLMVTRPGGEFAFLEGRSPVAQYRMQPTYIGQGDQPTRILVYSYRATDGEEIAIADRELLSQGYKSQGGGSGNAVYLPAGSRTQESEIVMIYRNTRTVPGQNLRRLGADPGWITVQIIGREKPSLLERLWNWIGV